MLVHDAIEIDIVFTATKSKKLSFKGKKNNWEVYILKRHTFSHGLEVHLSTEAPEPSNSPSTHLENIDGAWL